MDTAPLVDKVTCLSSLSPVSISVLGYFQLIANGNGVSIKSDSKAERLLLCLTLAHAHRLHRAPLLERIWPGVEPTLASQCLNSLTHSLNKSVGPYLRGNGLILYQSGYYCLNTGEGAIVDLDYFEAWSEQGKQFLANSNIEEGVAFCQKALTLYEGKLCGDSDLETLIERERLHMIFLDLLARLADQYYLHNDPTAALRYIQRLLTHDPCREDAHRLAMHCYLQLHQRTQALRQYRLCSEALSLEFDTQPEPETVALFEQIRLHPDILYSTNVPLDAF